MKMILATCAVVLFLSASACQAQTIEQCKSASKDLALVKTDSDFAKLVASMTAGDELALSTKLAKCVEQHSEHLTAPEVDKLSRFVYRLDADVIARMYDFLQQHHLADVFNDEQEAKRRK
jgi:hypothetical protein